MAPIIIIPIIIVTIVGLVGYLVYRFIVYDMMCKKNVSRTLQRYNIRQSPFQILKEYHLSKGRQLSDGEIRSMEKEYRQNEPDQFLAMYDSIRDSFQNDKGRTE